MRAVKLWTKHCHWHKGPFTKWTAFKPRHKLEVYFVSEKYLIETVIGSSDTSHMSSVEWSVTSFIPGNFEKYSLVWNLFDLSVWVWPSRVAVKLFSDLGNGQHRSCTWIQIIYDTKLIIHVCISTYFLYQWIFLVRNSINNSDEAKKIIFVKILRVFNISEGHFSHWHVFWKSQMSFISFPTIHNISYQYWTFFFIQNGKYLKI